MGKRGGRTTLHEGERVRKAAAMEQLQPSELVDDEYALGGSVGVRRFGFGHARHPGEMLVDASQRRVVNCPAEFSFVRLRACRLFFDVAQIVCAPRERDDVVLGK